jgi:hypothetical protein
VTERKAVRHGEWIKLGTETAVDAVVCDVYESTRSNGADAAVVYRDAEGRAVYEEVRWDGSRWDFLYSGPCGLHARCVSCAEKYLEVLERGRTDA